MTVKSQNLETNLIGSIYKVNLKSFYKEKEEGGKKNERNTRLLYKYKIKVS